MLLQHCIHIIHTSRSLLKTQQQHHIPWNLLIQLRHLINPQCLLRFLRCKPRCITNSQDHISLSGPLLLRNQLIPIPLRNIRPQKYVSRPLISFFLKSVYHSQFCSVSTVKVVIVEYCIYN